MSVTTKTRKSCDEYVVALYINGIHQVEADYFTEDREDAATTAKAMVKQAKEQPLQLVKTGFEKVLKTLQEDGIYTDSVCTIFRGLCEQYDRYSSTSIAVPIYWSSRCMEPTALVACLKLLIGSL